MLVHHRVTWFIYYEVTRSITTPPWMGYASPSQGDLVICYEVNRSIVTPFWMGL